MSSKRSPQQSFATLRQFIRERAPVERCEMCSAELAPDHQHLFESSSRQLVCACDACVILFSSQGGSKYRKVPRRIQFLPTFNMTDGQWESLMIPVNMAFFFYSSAEAKMMVFYPGPAGATESLLTLGSWKEILQDNPVLYDMEPDVEALLVNRVGRTQEHYVAPIDECYKLVGIIRTNWKGLSGGSEVWKEIERFFAGLKEKSIEATSDEFIRSSSSLPGGKSHA